MIMSSLWGADNRAYWLIIAIAPDGILNEH